MARNPCFIESIFCVKSFKNSECLHLEALCFIIGIDYEMIFWPAYILQFMILAATAVCNIS